MKVLFNALQAGNRSGTGRYTVQLLHGLNALQGPDFEVIAAWPRDLDPPEGMRVPSARYGGGTLQRLLDEHFKLPKSADEAAADLLHYPANFGPWRARKPVVVTVHDLSFLRHPEWFPRSRSLYYRHAIRRTVRTATRIIADSEATAADLRELLRVPGEKVDVIPLGVEPRFAPASAAAQQAAREKYRLPERFFLYIGTLEPRKNLAALIRAWVRIAWTIEEDLVIAGRAGWRMGALAEAIAENPHPDRLHLPEHIKDADLPAVLSAATAFVWPSLWEGFGLPPLEAMACGVPVLCSSTSSLPEVTGDAALLVNPTDEAAIGAGMQGLAQDTALRDTLHAQGLKRAAEFTWRRTAMLTLESYRKAVQAAPRSPIAV